MAQVPDEIMTILKKYVAELERNNIHLEAVVLFGSYATGVKTLKRRISLSRRS